MLNARSGKSKNSVSDINIKIVILHSLHANKTLHFSVISYLVVTINICFYNTYLGKDVLSALSGELFDSDWKGLAPKEGQRPLTAHLNVRVLKVGVYLRCSAG